MPTMPTTDAISALAYEYWQAEGCPHGKDMEHWLKAEQALGMPMRPMKDQNLLRAAAATPRRHAGAAAQRA
jgi:hypothetical protein